jgi:hypothetical protein
MGWFDSKFQYFLAYYRKNIPSVSIAGNGFSSNLVKSFITSICSIGWQLATSSTNANEIGVPSTCFSRYFGVVVASTQRRTPRPTEGYLMHWKRVVSSPYHRIYETIKLRRFIKPWLIYNLYDANLEKRMKTLFESQSSKTNIKLGPS